MTSSRKIVSGLLFSVVCVLLFSPSANAFPAFARKYGLRCSACHEAWPMLNYFGQKFKDNGYQLMNDRDSPVWQNPSYWPVTFRITPFWSRESTNKVAVDTTAGINAGETQLTNSSFNVSGLDILSGGTLENNLSVLFVLSSDEFASFHFESVNVRFDNVFHSPWANFKFGKFELDNFVSEKRELTLSGNGATYQIYHFIPVGDGNIFGQMGDNQFGAEWMGHSFNDRTRASAAVFSSTDGNVDDPYGKNAYTGFFTASQAFDAGKAGVERIGAYVMYGEAPTFYLTSGGAPIPGSGTGNKTFSREGIEGLIYLGKFNFQFVTQHGEDSAWFGACYGDLVDGICPNNNIPGTVLPAGARNPTWNGAYAEFHYTLNPQLIFIEKNDWVRMSQQALPGTPGNLGNIDNYTFALRWYVIMNNRAGFALHPEYSWLRLRGESPVTGSDLTSSSLMLGWDFDF